jgi:hypothetical protein
MVHNIFIKIEEVWQTWFYELKGRKKEESC